MFVQVVRNGRRAGPPGSPVAFETEFGWVLAGEVKPFVPCYHISSHHVALESGDDLLRRFWEIEQQPDDEPIWSPEEKSVFQHFTSVTVMGDSWFFYHEEQMLKTFSDHKLFIV